MIADNFTIRGTNTKTGRRKKLHTTAFSEHEAIDFVKGKGLVEPFEIERKTPQPTEKQLSYARDLGASIPPNSTREDLRAIIQKQLDGGSEPSLGLKAFAKGRKILFSRYVGKSELYELIFNQLEEKDLVAFFAFCVYRWVSDDRKSNLDTHPSKHVFYSFAEKFQHDQRWMKSFYGNYDGENIKFFGKIITNDGWEIEGGSPNTIAYQEVCKYLADTMNISVSRKTKNFQRERPKPTNQNKLSTDAQEEFSVEGCGCLVVLVVLVIMVIYWLF